MMLKDIEIINRQTYLAWIKEWKIEYQILSDTIKARKIAIKHNAKSHPYGISDDKQRKIQLYQSSAVKMLFDLEKVKLAARDFTIRNRYEV